MGIRNFDAIAITDSRKRLMDGFGSISLPLLSNGDEPKFVAIRVSPGTAAGNVIFIAPKVDATVASLGTGFPIDADTSRGVILNIFGYQNIGFGRTGDDTSFITVTALTDF